MPATDEQLRKLSMALWRDFVKWAEENEAGGLLQLFRAEPSGRIDPTNGIHPLGHEAEWAFVPAADLLLVVGQGMLGINCQGIVGTDGLKGYDQETFEECSLRLGALDELLSWNPEELPGQDAIEVE